jgi:16S rRNA (guanine527-N7)-methyltransferase
MSDDASKAQLSGRVSRETFERLERYADLLTRWQKTINLVAPSTLNAIWTRHMLDSAQLMDHVPVTAKSWLDLGSGGGFPGLVCAVMAAETHPDLSITLVEADLRKAAFLREVARQMGISVGIMSRRIEDLPPQKADIVSARALAPLVSLCRYAAPHLAEHGICLFQKGVRYQDELETAQSDWHMTCQIHTSITDPDAVLLKIEGLRHA